MNYRIIYHIFSILTVLGILGPHSFAVEPKVTLSVSCPDLYREILQKTLPQIATGKPLEAHAGSLSHLGTLMRRAGLPDSSVQGPLNFIETVLADPHGPILSNTSQRLIAASDSSDKLLVCVISNKCDLVHGSAIHAHFGDDFKITSFNETATRSNFTTNVTVRGNARVEAQVKPPSVIFLKADVMNAVELIHEATHFADFQLISEWIEANLKLIKKGLEPDLIFKRFARTTDSGVEVDEGFIRVFLESRGYSAESQAITYMRDSIPEPHLQTWVQDRQNAAIHDLQGYGGITKAAIDEYGVTKSNIFATGERFGKEMEETISRAKASDAETTTKSDTPRSLVTQSDSSNAASFPNTTALGFTIDRTVQPVDDTTYDILSAIYSPPKRRFQFRGPRKIKSSDVDIPEDVLKAAISEVEAAGGKIVYTTREERGINVSSGNVYFRVNRNGTPEIGLEWGNEEGQLAAFMESFKQWRDARDILINRGLKKKQAALRAWIEGFSPERQFRERLNSAAARSNASGYYDLRAMRQKFKDKGLNHNDVARIVSSLTGSHVNVLRNTIFMRREVLKRLKKLGVDIEGKFLNFPIEGRVNEAPSPVRLTWNPSNRLIEYGGQTRQIATRSDDKITELVTLFNQLDAQAKEIADHAVYVNHTIREEATQRLEELAKLAEQSGNSTEAEKLRKEAARILKDENDTFGQFIFGYGRRIDADGTGGPIMHLLKERQQALREAGWPQPRRIQSLPPSPSD